MAEAAILALQETASPKSMHDVVRLNNGIQIPAFGLGVYQARRGQETYAAVLTALKDGYRLIDTAAIYGNEGDVGSAIRDSGIPRKEIFVTTKLWNSDHGYEPCRRALMPAWTVWVSTMLTCI